jgi:diguanylate cyclase (GGDEF)-like protein/PAS domain S-box-containing protein
LSTLPSLKTKIAVAVILMVACVALIVTSLSFFMMKQRVKQIITEHQSSLLSATAREIDQKFAIRLHALQAQAKEIGSRDFLNSRQSGLGLTQTMQLQKYLEQHWNEGVLFDNLVVFSRTGELLANASLPSKQSTVQSSVGISSRPYFDDTLRLNRSMISLPIIGTFTKKPLVAITAPISEPSGLVRFVLVGAINLQTKNFIVEVGETKIGRTGYVCVMATDGTLIAGPKLNGQQKCYSKQPASARPKAESQALAGFEGTVQGRDRDDVAGLYSFKRLSTAPWILMAFYPDQEAFAPLIELEHRALLAAVAMIVLIGPLAWVFIGWQLQPLKKLQQRIVVVKDQPTLALAPQQYADDEIGRLSMHFDHLIRDRLFNEARYQTGAEELRAATNSGPDAFFIFQAQRDESGSVIDFTIRYLNANAERMLGQTLEQLTSQSLRTALHGHQIATLFNQFVDVLSTSQSVQSEVCIAEEETAQGMGMRWFQHQIVPQADGVTLTARDITDRKRDEIEIRSNRAFLQSLTDHLPMLFYAKRFNAAGEGRLVTWNHAAEQITGFTSADVLGKTNRDIYSANLAAAYDAHDQAILDHPIPMEIPATRFHRADGTVRYLHVRSVPIFDSAGKVEYIIGIGEDITERRLQDQVLRLRQAELQAVNDSSPLGLFMTDLAGNCTYLNRTYEVMSGAESQQIVGDAWFKSLHPDDQNAAIEAWVLAIQDHEAYRSVHRFLHPDGRVLWGSFKAVPITIDQQISGYVGSVDDITERLDIEEALRASEQRLRLVTDNIPALIGYVKPNQHFAFANRKYNLAYAVSTEQLTDLSVQEVLGADVYNQSAAYIEDALRGQPAAFERLVTHVGALRWERVHYVPDIDESGQTRGFFSLVENITELKQAQHTFAKSEMRLRMITDNLPALISYIDRDRCYRFCNGYYETVLGLKPEKILGLRMDEVVSQEGYSAIAPQIATVLAGGRVNFERHVVSGGIDRHFAYDYIPDVGTDGSVIGFYSMVLDITARKTAELKQAAGEKLLRTLTDNLPALVGFIDHDEKFQFNNQVYAQWLNKPLSEITGRSMREVYGDEKYVLYKPYFEQALEGKRVEFEFEATRHGEQQFYRAAYAPQIDSDGRTTGVCSMISDITALKKVENQLRVLARFDSLTGLPNRNHFEEKLSEAIARSSRSHRPMAVMFLDIDHFKQINDTIGHHGGDAVLREFAQRLQTCVRKTDTVSRLAGDEFTIILEGLQMEDETQIVANKIIVAMQEVFRIGEDERIVTTSIGIAVRRHDETSSESLLRRADEALYVAKSSGRNTFETMC